MLQLDEADARRGTDELGAVFTSACVVDTGASYDVVPIGFAEKYWKKIELNEVSAWYQHGQRGNTPRYLGIARHD